MRLLPRTKMGIVTALYRVITGLELMSIHTLGWSGTFEVPLHKTNGWQFLHYRKIQPNTFRAIPAGLEISVTNSAAPAIFPLTNELEATEMQFSGKLSGTLKIPPGKQGEKGYDDYVIRVGLVESGDRMLNWREKLTAADWVKKLYGLAPRGTGISKIHFLNVGVDLKKVGKTRTQPLSNLMQEIIIAVPAADGRFAVTNSLRIPLKYWRYGLHVMEMTRDRPSRSSSIGWNSKPGLRA